jgi:hypothetical protein
MQTWTCKDMKKIQKKKITAMELKANVKKIWMNLGFLGFLFTFVCLLGFGR